MQRKTNRQSNIQSFADLSMRKHGGFCSMSASFPTSQSTRLTRMRLYQFSYGRAALKTFFKFDAGRMP